jgi:hypothetical protein
MDLDPERRRELAEATAAYQHLMDEVVTESQYCRRVENPERVAYLGNIIERADARQRERERAEQAGGP